MKLFKVLVCVGQRAGSLFAPHGADIRVNPGDYMTASQYDWVWRTLREMGFSDYQITAMLTAWFTHMAYDMRYGVGTMWERVYTQVGQMYEAYLEREQRETVIFFVAAAGVIIIASVLYEVYRQRVIEFSPPEEMYLLTYNEIALMAELAAVSPKGVGLYEQAGVSGGGIVEHERHVPLPPGEVDRLWFVGTMAHMFRHWLIFYRYYWDRFDCYYCGMTTHIGGGLYKLRAGGHDPFLPEGPWYRSGGAWGTPEYDGIFKDHRWLDETF